MSVGQQSAPVSKAHKQKLSPYCRYGKVPFDYGPMYRRMVEQGDRGTLERLNSHGHIVRGGHTALSLHVKLHRRDLLK